MSAQTSGAQDDVRVSWEDFLRFQQAYSGDERLIWDQGRIVVAMTGGTERHDLTIAAFNDRLRATYRGSNCHVFTHNRQLKTEKRSYYPDVLVRCGDAAHPLYDHDARFVIEVLSPSNKPANRTEMLYDYQTLPSIEMIVFVDTRVRTATIHQKGEAGVWTERATRNGTLTLGDAVIDLAQLWVEVDEESTFD